MYYYDLHCHTNASEDSSAEIRKTVRLAKKRGLDGIAITDHNKPYKGPMMIEGLDIISGSEVTMKDGSHLLAYFVKDRITPRLELKETVREVRSQGGYAVLAHPLRGVNGWIKNNEGDGGAIAQSFKIIDGLESGNGSDSDEEMALVAKMAREAGLVQTAGSDLHMSSQVGFSVVAVKERIKQDNFIEVLKEAEIIIRPEAKIFRSEVEGSKNLAIKTAKMLGLYNNEIANYLFSVLAIRNFFWFKNRKFKKFEFNFKEEAKTKKD